MTVCPRNKINLRSVALNRTLRNSFIWWFAALSDTAFYLVLALSHFPYN